jgi:hypothetical protein
MTSKDNQGSVGSEQQSNLKNPDRRRVLGATAVAAAVGTVGQAGSRALAQAHKGVSEDVPSGIARDISALKKAMQQARDQAAPNPDGHGNPIDLNKYIHSFRIHPGSQAENHNCACGCS